MPEVTPMSGGRTCWRIPLDLWPCHGLILHAFLRVLGVAPGDYRERCCRRASVQSG